MTRTISIEANGRTMTAELADNSSADALAEMLREGPIKVRMNDYGSMEKVGSLGRRLPTNDRHMDTDAGDVILYQGSYLVIYYDRNSWSLTGLGRIKDVGKDGLRSILGDGDVTVTLSLP